ncbi:MAG TPA: hypothetical protein PLL30_03215 [Candidatus Krumholzibacteria bacterium]|nr:hypothetical protein [Candidatus Krumholzibacteria bacterium]HPD70782.1 hypothetical protein [Candidatus Krumholzibacteria bacterium]HRY39518.1 hypothetical protein [Candidatus Krumholzibacteria bacterium]
MPRRSRRGGAILALTALASLGLPALAGDRAVTGKDRHPDGRAADYARDVVPCDAPRQELDLSPGLQLAFADTTSGAGAVAGYACEPGWVEAGPEHVYALTATDDLVLDAWLAGNEPDLDLVLLSACDTDSCLAQANTEVSALLAAGRTYYLVVDGFQEAAGPYLLSLETRHAGLADLVCEPGGAVPVAIDGAGLDLLQGDLFGAPNLVSIFDCAEIAARGGEVWYALTMAAADTDTTGAGYGEYLSVACTVAPAAATLDVALWVFAGCGPDAECLAFVDGANAGGDESLIWANQDPEPRTVYLAVDCLRPAGESGGAYDLTFNATVPVEPRTFTDVRRLFR